METTKAAAAMAKAESWDRTVNVQRDAEHQGKKEGASFSSLIRTTGISLRSAMVWTQPPCHRLPWDAMPPALLVRGCFDFRRSALTLGFRKFGD
jgi:hypothetical protein